MRVFDRLIDLAARTVKDGSLEIVHSSGKRVLRGAGEPAIQVRVQDRGLSRRLVAHGAAALGDGYVKGDWSVSELAAFLKLASDTRDRVVSSRLARPFHRISVWVRRFLVPGRRGPVESMAQHYDLGNDFYSAWLDPTMMYSSALFEGSDDLEIAQRRKNQRICQAAGIGQGSRVLEIGFGWGGFAEIALEAGASITGLTISQEQLAYSRHRLSRFGDRVDLRLVDFEEATLDQHDAVVSIEMIESIEQDRWPALFRTCAAATKPGGKVVFQIIVIDDSHWESYRISNDFIRQYVFPGGRVPPPKLIRKHAAEAGLEVTEVFDFGDSYAQTLASWNQRFQAAWPGLQGDQFDDDFKRMWEYYLAYCQAGFETGRISVQQWTFTKSA